jgi:chromatin segregation and condensation protein Rec8/ScpA/Scc1 (kleisin family)
VIDTSRDDLVATTEAKERLKEVFELCEAAEILVRESFRRRFPDAEESEIERRVGEWRLERPGSRHGDASGPHFRLRR